MAVTIGVVTFMACAWPARSFSTARRADAVRSARASSTGRGTALSAATARFTVTNSIHGIVARSVASRSSPEPKITGVPTRPHESPTSSVSVIVCPWMRNSIPSV